MPSTGSSSRTEPPARRVRTCAGRRSAARPRATRRCAAPGGRGARRRGGPAPPRAWRVVDGDAVAPTVLGPVQRHVGAAEQVVGRPSWPIAMPALDVHTNGSGRPGRSIGERQPAQDVARHDRGGLDTADPGTMTTNSSRRDGPGPHRAGRRPRADGDLAQQRVADLVPEGVVDELETVEVQQHEGHGVLRRRPIEGLGEADVEHGPVGQPGEGVALGEGDEFAVDFSPRRRRARGPGRRWCSSSTAARSSRGRCSVPSRRVTRKGYGAEVPAWAAGSSTPVKGPRSSGWMRERHVSRSGSGSAAGRPSISRRRSSRVTTRWRVSTTRTPGPRGARPGQQQPRAADSRSAAGGVGRGDQGAPGGAGRGRQDLQPREAGATTPSPPPQTASRGARGGPGRAPRRRTGTAREVGSGQARPRDEQQVAWAAITSSSGTGTGDGLQQQDARVAGGVDLGTRSSASAVTSEHSVKRRCARRTVRPQVAGEAAPGTGQVDGEAHVLDVPQGSSATPRPRARGPVVHAGWPPTLAIRSLPGSTLRRAGRQPVRHHAT